MLLVSIRILHEADKTDYSELLIAIQQQVDSNDEYPAHSSINLNGDDTMDIIVYIGDEGIPLQVYREGKRYFTRTGKIDHSLSLSALNNLVSYMSWIEDMS